MKTRRLVLGAGLALTIAAASPAWAVPALPVEVVGATWQWVSFITPKEKIEVDAPDRYTLEFTAEGRIAMQADCNRGMGGYTVADDKRITFEPIALTRMLCPEGSLSDRFVHEVGRATSFFQKDGDFFLELPFDSGTLRFRRKP